MYDNMHMHINICINVKSYLLYTRCTCFLKKFINYFNLIITHLHNQINLLNMERYYDKLDTYKAWRGKINQQIIKHPRHTNTEKEEEEKMMKKYNTRHNNCFFCFVFQFCFEDLIWRIRCLHSGIYQAPNNALVEARAWGNGGDQLGQLKYPEGIVVTRTGAIWVADCRNDRLCLLR